MGSGEGGGHHARPPRPMNAIFFGLRTGCPWKARSATGLGASSVAYRCLAGVEQSFSVRGLLVPPDEQPAEAVHPAVCTLHHPAPRAERALKGPDLRRRGRDANGEACQRQKVRRAPTTASHHATVGTPPARATGAPAQRNFRPSPAASPASGGSRAPAAPPRDRAHRTGPSL